MCSSDESAHNSRDNVTCHNYEGGRADALALSEDERLSSAAVDLGLGTLIE